jgi:uncharacterized protein (DUF1697 family)
VKQKMTTYISFLRGINVGGAKKILMSDLRNIYEGLGFKKVTTYIQSGNVIFQAEDQLYDEEAAEMIGKALFRINGYEVPVLVRTAEKMQKTLINNPFIRDSTLDPEKMHVTFLAEMPQEKQLEKIRNYDYSPERFEIVGKDVFLYCPNGYGTSRLSNGFFENKLKVSSTTRNWRTVNTLVEIATGEPYSK